MASGISSRTKVCGIFGYPLEHTFSPAMHNAAFEAAGLDFVYLPFPVDADRLQEAVASVRFLGLVGVNVTIPHKEAVLPLLDELSEEARLIGAVNTIVNHSGRLYGENTDGRGFLCSPGKLPTSCLPVKPSCCWEPGAQPGQGGSCWPGSKII